MAKNCAADWQLAHLPLVATAVFQLLFKRVPRSFVQLPKVCKPYSSKTTRASHLLALCWRRRPSSTPPAAEGGRPSGMEDGRHLWQSADEHTLSCVFERLLVMDEGKRWVSQRWTRVACAYPHLRRRRRRTLL